MKHQQIKALSFCALSALALLPSLSVQQVLAHGYSTYPEARQVKCANEGGFWSGTPPMAGCAAANEISGSYPFVQINEFAINIPDYFNQAAVEAAVPDGTLCHANDPRKVGMSAINDPSAWTRTELAAGTFTYTFNATAPHNPSFWKFYITKQGTDLSQPLKWSDLELIKEDNDSVVGSSYSTSLTIPVDRSGDHILFVRWQRIDPVGEGFYNCSDITVVNNDTTVPEPTEPDLVQGEQYVLPEYNVGDRVIFEVINRNGEVHNSFSMDVTSANVQFIPELLAAEVSGYYDSFHDGNVFIGAWHPEMNHYMYFNNGMPNYFNAKNANASYAVRVQEAIAEPITLGLKELLMSDHIIEHGEYASVFIEGDFDIYVIEELTNTGVELTHGSTYAFVGTQSIAKALLPAEVTLRVTTNPNDANAQQKSISFTVMDGEDNAPTPGNASAWNPAATYTSGDRVSFNSQIWEAQWWVQGGANPEATYDGDIWGVWRPVQ